MIGFFVCAILSIELGAYAWGRHAEPAFGNDHRTPGKSESRSQAVCESWNL